MDSIVPQSPSPAASVTYSPNRNPLLRPVAPHGAPVPPAVHEGNPANRSQDEQWAAQTGAQSGIPYFDTRQLKSIEASTGVMSLGVMEAYHVAPLHMNASHGLELGITEKTDRSQLPNLQEQMGDVKLTFKTISTSGYTHILNSIFYQSFQTDRDGDFKQFGKKLSTAPPKQAFQLIAQLAFWLGASDIHIEPQAQSARIRFRLDGILHPITQVVTDSYKIFLSDLQTRAEISWGSDKPQSGRISYNLMNNDARIVPVNMRIETIPTFMGEEIVVRIFNAETKTLNLEDMGFSERQISLLKKVSDHPNGMMLTVGPTGSGKTSTLYAILNRLNKPDRKIVTLEDPVEFNLPGVSQIPVKTDDKDLFASKLRAVMREDPDVVMIGEIRDIDTAKTALQAALTGHLVLSTFHATDAAAAISRMMDMIGQNPLFASAVRLIVAQRLARRICPACTIQYEATLEELDFVKAALGDVPENRRPAIFNKTVFAKSPKGPKLMLRRGQGCPECHGLGYKGRVAVLEMMVITPEIEALMTRTGTTTAQDLSSTAMKSGMIPLIEDGIRKAAAGLTTVLEIMRLSEVKIDQRE